MARNTTTKPKPAKTDEAKTTATKPDATTTTTPPDTPIPPDTINPDTPIPPDTTTLPERVYVQGHEKPAEHDKVDDNLDVLRRAEQHAKEDAARRRRDDVNREGHERNMAEIEKAAVTPATPTPSVDVPPTGKQIDRNTPIIDKDGNKVWR